MAAGRRLVGGAAAGSSGGSQRTGSARGLRKMTPVGSVAPSSSRRPGQPSSAASSAASVSSRARCRPTQACGPWAKARCVRASGRAMSNVSGSGICGRIAVGGRQRHDDEVAPRDPRAAELDVRRRIAIDPRGRRLEAQRLVDRVRAEGPIGAEGRQLAGARSAGARTGSWSCPRRSRCRRTS